MHCFTFNTLTPSIERASIKTIEIEFQKCQWPYSYQAVSHGSKKDKTLHLTMLTGLKTHQPLLTINNGATNGRGAGGGYSAPIRP